jgi:hypothetical protein
MSVCTSVGIVMVRSKLSNSRSRDSRKDVETFVDTPLLSLDICICGNELSKTQPLRDIERSEECLLGRNDSW